MVFPSCVPIPAISPHIHLLPLQLPPKAKQNLKGKKKDLCPLTCGWGGHDSIKLTFKLMSKPKHLQGFVPSPRFRAFVNVHSVSPSSCGRTHFPPHFCLQITKKQNNQVLSPPALSSPIQRGSIPGLAWLCVLAIFLMFATADYL